MVEQRLPHVDDDDGDWGDILNQYLSKEHYDTGLDNAANGGHQKITVRAGSASAGTAPIKLTSGPLMATPEVGAIEFLTDRLYFTQTASTTRKAIAAYNDDGSGATGDTYYRDVSANFVRRAIGSTNDILTVSGGVPTWSNTLTDPRINTIKDTNGANALNIVATASAANYMQVSNKASGSSPGLEAIGSDANVNMLLTPKGSGDVRIFGAAGQTPTLSAQGADTNHNLNLVPKGTGKVQAAGVEVVTISGTQILTGKTLTSPVINTSVSGTAVATIATASTLALRDANGNLTADAYVTSSASIATNGGTTALSITDVGVQIFTGTLTHTVTLPTTSIVAGAQYTIVNKSTQVVTVQSSGVNTISAMAANTAATFTAVVPTPTTAANWASSYVVAGSGTVTATAGALASNAVVLGAGLTDTKTAAGIITDGISKITLGTSGTNLGSVSFNNATSGTINLAPPTGVALGTSNLVLPVASDTLVGKATTDTLTNKTINANGTGNSITNLETADFATNVVDTDGTLAANSDTRLASQKAVKTYVDGAEAASIASNSNLVPGGDMQTPAKWTNAWGTHSTEQSPISGGYSRKLTSTGVGIGTEYLSVTHNGTGTEIYFQAINSRRLNIGILIRKHASNVGGGNMVFRCVPINLDGTDATIIDNTTNPTSGMSNSSFTNYGTSFQVGSPRLGYKIRIGFDTSVPSGDIFYIGGIVITDVTGAVMYWTSDTLTNKTISGNDNIITDLGPDSIYNVTDLMGSEMVINGDFQIAANWVNAWGVQSTDQSLVSGGYSRKLTSTNGGVTVDRLGLLHDGSGTNIGSWANQPRAHTWRVAIRKHASNTGGGNIILRTRWTDYAGASFTTTTTYSESVLSNSAFSILAITHSTTTAYRYFYCYIEMESIPAGDIFYIGSASVVDNSGAVTPTATQTLTFKTLTNPSVHNFTEGVIAIGTVGSTNTLDLTSTNTAGGTGGTVLTATLTSATPCTFTMPTATAGKSFTLMLKQPAAGSATSATFTSVKWNVAGSPTITATIGKMDILSFFADGTSWYGSYTQGYTP